MSWKNCTLHAFAQQLVRLDRLNYAAAARVNSVMTDCRGCSLCVHIGRTSWRVAIRGKHGAGCLLTEQESQSLFPNLRVRHGLHMHEAGKSK